MIVRNCSTAGSQQAMNRTVKPGTPQDAGAPSSAIVTRSQWVEQTGHWSIGTFVLNSATRAMRYGSSTVRDTRFEMSFIRSCPTIELTGRGDYIQPSNQTIKLRKRLSALRSNDLFGTPQHFISTYDSIFSMRHPDGTAPAAEHAKFLFRQLREIAC